MALESEHALLGLIVPHLNFVVISTTYKHWLRLMEMHTTNRPIMLLELVNKRLSTIIYFGVHKMSPGKPMVLNSVLSGCNSTTMQSYIVNSLLQLNF